MVGFHMLHQGARRNVFPVTQRKGVGTLLMFAVRSIFADPPRVAREMKALAAKGLVEKWLGETDDPLGFLVHEGGAASMIEAAYRFARHEPGVDVMLFGTGDAAHLRANVASLIKPPLPEADRAKLVALFGHLKEGIGLDSHQAAPARRQVRVARPALLPRRRWAPSPLAGAGLGERGLFVSPCAVPPLTRRTACSDLSRKGRGDGVCGPRMSFRRFCER